jgi:hypothetical protein
MKPNRLHIGAEELGEMYEIAFREWAESEDSKLWDAVLADGLEPDDWSGFDDGEAELEGIDVAEDGQQG